MEKRKRKRINSNAICSSENYRESRRVHNNMLRVEHDAFSLHALAAIRAECEEELSFERRTALQRMKERDKYVWIPVFGKPTQISRERYEKYYKPYGVKTINK